MKFSLKLCLVASVLFVGLAANANAQTGAPSTATAPSSGPTSVPMQKGNHPCMSEHQTVMAQCEKGDPCGASCKQAHQAMKACRAANHLPTHPSTGTKKPNPCKTIGSSTPQSGGSAPGVQPAP